MRALFPVMLALAAPCGQAMAKAPAPPPEIESIPIAMMADLGSGQVLFARKPDTPFLPASMTKVMTAYVAFTQISAGKLALDKTFTVRPETAKVWNGRGTSMYLRANEQVSADDLLRGIMTASANDASVVLAEGQAGSVADWTALMNRTAAQLGMTRSRFNTPNGWPDEGRTKVTASDLVRLSSAMIRRYPRFYKRYAGKQSFNWNGVTLTSHDPVAGAVEGADGIKTGYTREAGYNFLGSAERDGRRLVMVVAGAGSEGERAGASRAFLEWGYSAWRKQSLFPAGARIGSARVQLGSETTVPLVAKQPIYAAIPNGETPQVTLSIQYRGPVKAPIAKGARIADLRIRVDGMTASRVPLYAASDIPEASLLDRISNGFMNLIS